MHALNIPIPFYQKMFSREHNANTILFTLQSVPCTDCGRENGQNLNESLEFYVIACLRYFTGCTSANSKIICPEICA